MAGRRKNSTRTDTDDEVPQFRRLQQELLAQVLRGDYRPGDRFPSEADMVAQFGLSRTTVNKAIAELAKLGLVKRNKRAGTVVSREFHERLILPLYDISVDLKKRGKIYKFKTLSRATVENGGGNIDWPDASAKASILSLEIVHYANDVPVMHERRYVNIAVAAGIEREAFENTPPSKWLLEHVPWTRVQHRISAISIADDLAEILRITPATPCVVIERSTFFFDQPITIVHMTLAGERFDVAGEYSLSTI
jgi:GntR family transcriptional regulator, histidine utilization repressor